MGLPAFFLWGWGWGVGSRVGGRQANEQSWGADWYLSLQNMCVNMPVWSCLLLSTDSRSVQHCFVRSDFRVKAINSCISSWQLFPRNLGLVIECGVPAETPAKLWRGESAFQCLRGSYICFYIISMIFSFCYHMFRSLYTTNTPSLQRHQL